MGYVREGYKNSVMYEYLALSCARQGGLHEKLQQAEIYRELFQSAGDLLEALITEGSPAEDISAYSSAAAVVENFIRHARQHANGIADFNILHLLKDFLSELQNAPEACRQNGWSEDVSARCLTGIAAILDSRDWKPQVYEDLKSGDNVVYWNAKQAARRLGIDLWETIWHRLQDKPDELSSWYDVTLSNQPEHAAEVIDFALRYLPLDQLATGPVNSLGLGQDYMKYSCLDAVITYLENYPRQGEKLVLTGLKSPVTRNRNMAIRVLGKWKRENWSPEIERELLHLRDIEPNEDTRADIDKLLS